MNDNPQTKYSCQCAICETIHPWPPSDEVMQWSDKANVWVCAGCWESKAHEEKKLAPYKPVIESQPQQPGAATMDRLAEQLAETKKKLSEATKANQIITEGWNREANNHMVAEAELATLRTQNSEQAKRIVKLEDANAEISADRDKLREEVERLIEQLNWQNNPNRREPVRGGYEFYVNEEWTGIRGAAMDEEIGFSATLMKVRYDPDDERVRIRRVLDDDAILHDLASAVSERDSLRRENAELKAKLEKGNK